MSNKAKDEVITNQLKYLPDAIEKIQIYPSSYFIGQSYFFNDWAQLGVINFFVFYELDTWSRDLNADFTLNDCLLGNVKLTKNSDTDIYSYFGCGIGFYSR